MRLKRPPFRYPWVSSKAPPTLEPNKVKIAQWHDDIAAARATYDDRHAGTLPEEKISRIKNHFVTNGYAFLGDCFQIQYADQMRATHKLDLDCTHAWSDLMDDGGTNSNPVERIPGHLRIGLPRTAPWVLPDMVANPIIEQVVAALMPSPLGRLIGWTGSTAIPDGPDGHVWMNSDWLWRNPEAAEKAGHTWPPPTTTVIVDFTTQVYDVMEENGAFELWPGTHMDTRVATFRHPNLRGRRRVGASYHPSWGNTDEAFERECAAEIAERREQHPPVRCLLPRGMVCFRDARTWTRNVSNSCHWPTHVLSLAYESTSTASLPGVRLDGYADAREKLVFSQTAQSAFDGPVSAVDRNIRFVDTELVDHRGNCTLSNAGDARSVNSFASQDFWLPRGPPASAHIFPWDVPQWFNDFRGRWLSFL
eukprot:m.36162 g.36162  ORF g.36162 m.36162 type:complete len:421 (+) comp14454_c0_seq1:128-1390(+)